MTIGLIGLGIMGSAYAKNFAEAGQNVLGIDPDPAARDRVSRLGVTVAAEIDDRCNDCAVILISVASPDALHAIVSQLATVLNPGQVVVETGTFALADKQQAEQVLAGAQVTLLDCTVSGTGAQAAAKDIIMMASGPQGGLDQAEPYLKLITRKIMRVGPFGAGTKMKFVANHAVAVHNVAAAETLNYALEMGLEKQVIYEMLSTGAGQSKMSDLRMPLMMERRYEPPTASLRMFDKDLSIIGADISRLGLSAPLFSACMELYEQANQDLPEEFDTASVYEVYASRRPASK